MNKLVTSTEMFAKAYASGYAVGAFNINDMESIQGIVDAVRLESAPVILQAGRGGRRFATPRYIWNLVQAALETLETPVCLHLDHGDTFELCKAAVDEGYTSVMIDGSALSLEDNVRLTKRVVDYAHDHGAVVEGELGRLAGLEGDADDLFTNPDHVAEFVAATGVDSLAIAIGTRHGAHKFAAEPHLRFDVLDEVARSLPGFPIVLHGASSVDPKTVAIINRYGGSLTDARGVPEDALRRAASSAVCKINIDTDIKLSMTAALRKHLAEYPDHFDLRDYMAAARSAVTECVQHKIRNVLGCAGKA